MPAAKYWIPCALLVGLPLRASAQMAMTVDKPQMLGDWLVAQPEALTAGQRDKSGALLYPQGLVWNRRGELESQQGLRKILLDLVGYGATDKPVPQLWRRNLYQFVLARRATGRVPVRSADGRWLQVHTTASPLLQPGDAVTIPLRPTVVNVLRQDGSLCTVRHRTAAHAMDYLRACGADDKVDVAWVIEPDGTVFEYKVAAWNREAQNTLGPGSWIWAPSGDTWPASTSRRLADFLATLPPAGTAALEATAVVDPTSPGASPPPAWLATPQRAAAPSPRAAGAVAYPDADADDAGRTGVGSAAVPLTVRGKPLIAQETPARLAALNRGAEPVAAAVPQARGESAGMAALPEGRGAPMAMSATPLPRSYGSAIAGSGASTNGPSSGSTNGLARDVMAPRDPLPPAMNAPLPARHASAAIPDGRGAPLAEAAMSRSNRLSTAAAAIPDGRGAPMASAAIPVGRAAPMASGGSQATAAREATARLIASSTLPSSQAPHAPMAPTAAFPASRGEPMGVASAVPAAAPVRPTTDAAIVSTIASTAPAHVAPLADRPYAVGAAAPAGMPTDAAGVAPVPHPGTQAVTQAAAPIAMASVPAAAAAAGDLSDAGTINVAGAATPAAVHSVALPASSPARAPVSAAPLYASAAVPASRGEPTAAALPTPRGTAVANASSDSVGGTAAGTSGPTRQDLEATRMMVADTRGNGVGAGALATPATAGSSVVAAAIPDARGGSIAAPPAPTEPVREIKSIAPDPQPFPVTAGDWGEPGVLQTPTARMLPAGSATASYSYVRPYGRANLILQPLDWFEFGFRYTDIRNQAYGPADLSGTQTYKDKSIDATIRLMNESRYLPAVAFGVRDIGGTGLFSSEYFVGSKRTGNFDWSFGFGWGYVGNSGTLDNPLGLISSKFNHRSAVDPSVAGNLSFSSMFRGRIGLFGGVQYQTPWSPLILKAELDGNDYRNEPFNTDLHAKWPINLGVVYRATNYMDLSAGFERGNTAMVGVALHGNLAQLGAPKYADPTPLPIPPTRPEISQFQVNQMASDLEAQTGWRVRDITVQGPMLTVAFDNPTAVYLNEKIDRIATVLHRDAPADIDSFQIVQVRLGAPTASYTVSRDAWVAEHTRALAPSEHETPVMAVAPPRTTQALEGNSNVFSQNMKRWDFEVGPGYTQTLGGPNAFLLYAISAQAFAAYRLTESTWIAGDLSYRLLDNFNKFTYDAPSNLPRVRTYIREYMTTSRLNIPYLQVTHFGKIGASDYWSAYGGYLETMYGGFGAEWLHRKSNSPLAVGVDVNAVKQRNFDQDFGFRGYQTVTGNLTGYWDTGWNGVQVNLSAGRYLARDWGATLDISRHFQNGVVLGAYATKTNVSAAQFGEGSFDKGVYVSIPFDAISGRSSAAFANILWEPLLRDGGAKLQRQYPLYDLTNESSPRANWYKPAAPTP